MRRLLLALAFATLPAWSCAQAISVSVATTDSAPGSASQVAVLEDEPSTLLTGILAYYPLDDTSDVAGGGYTLTNNNSVTFGAGKLGNAAIFSSNSTGYLSQSVTQLGTNAAGSSASCWVRWNASNSSLVIIAGENTTTNNAWRMQMAGSTGRPAALVRATGLLFANSTTTINNSAWHHVVFTYGPSDRQLRVYVDNGSPTIAGTGTTDTLAFQNLGWVFGGDSGLGNMMGLNTVAELDECGIWDKELTATEVACLNGSGTPPAYPFTGVCTP